MSSDQNSKNDLGIIWEVENIAKYLGLSQRQTFNLVHKGLIPARKIGRKWFARKEELARFFSENGDSSE